MLLHIYWHGFQSHILNIPQSVEAHISRIGPSGVRALPLAAGINEGGHYFRYWSERSACAALGCWHKQRWPLLVRAECVRCPWLLAQTKVATIFITFFHFFFLLPPLFKTTEGVVVLFQIFAWAPKNK